MNNKVTKDDTSDQGEKQKTGAVQSLSPCETCRPPTGHSSLTLADVVEGKMTVQRLKHEPSIGSKVSAAVFISVMGAPHSGISTKAQLMWPCVQFDDYQVQREAASLLSGLHTALLEVLPHSQIQKILTDQVERLPSVDVER